MNCLIVFKCFKPNNYWIPFHDLVSIYLWSPEVLAYPWKVKVHSFNRMNCADFGNPFVFPCKAIVTFTSVIFKWNKLRLEWNLVQTLMFTKVRFLSFFHCARVQASTLALHLASASICICLLGIWWKSYLLRGDVSFLQSIKIHVTCSFPYGKKSPKCIIHIRHIRFSGHRRTSDQEQLPGC